MNLTRVRVATTVAVTVGVALPTAGVAIGVAASSPSDSTPAGSSSTVSYTCAIEQFDPASEAYVRALTDAVGPATLELGLPATYDPGDSLLFPGGQAIGGRVEVDIPGLGLDDILDAPPKAVQFEAATASVNLTGASVGRTSLISKPTAVLPWDAASDVVYGFTVAPFPAVQDDTRPTVTAAPGGAVTVAFSGLQLYFTTYAAADGSGTGTRFRFDCAPTDPFSLPQLASVP
ncbi:MAG: hypothetical protein AAGC46_14375, partial [Solirubrobacteraceae bacterium]|nr:hypothetical protein [Patulibacter sp.]